MPWKSALLFSQAVPGESLRGGGAAGAAGFAASSYEGVYVGAPQFGQKGLVKPWAEQFEHFWSGGDARFIPDVSADHHMRLAAGDPSQPTDE
jgi:hypothetical protein